MGAPAFGVGLVLAATVLLWAVLVGGVLLIGVLVGSDSIAVADREVEVVLADGFEIFPDIIEVVPRTDLTFLVENTDDIQHDLTFAEASTGRLDPGRGAILEVGLVQESFVIWCSIRGHREQGMEAQVQVVTEESEPTG
jgi:hypothetical protein